MAFSVTFGLFFVYLKSGHPGYFLKSFYIGSIASFWHGFAKQQEDARKLSEQQTKWQDADQKELDGIRQV